MRKKIVKVYLLYSFRVCVCVCMFVCVYMCVSLGLIFGINILEKTAFHLLLDTKLKHKGKGMISLLYANIWIFALKWQ